MTIRKLVFFPEECLRRPTAPVTDFGEDFQTLVDDMFETMYHCNGVGLAAPQIGLSLNIAVLDCTAQKTQQLVIANPEILSREGEQVFEEGCLSVPGLYDKVIRSEKVVVRAQNRRGEYFEITGEGLLGECLQHEIEHLQGKLFIDLLPPVRRMRIRKQFLKMQRDKQRKGT